MLETIIENNPVLNKFLREFRQAFQNKAQVRHFQHYIIALMIYLGDKNLSGLSRTIPDGRHQCSLYCFLTKQKWNTAEVKQIRIDLLNRKVRHTLQAMRKHGQKPKVFLIIDDI